MVPHYTLRGEVLTEIVGIFRVRLRPYPPFYGLVGGPPVDLDTIPANVGQVMIYARLPEGVDKVEGVTRWTTAKMAGSVEYPHGVAVDFVCDLAPWLPNNCASASLVPDGGWVFGLEVAGLVFLVSLLMSGVTAVARRLRRRWRPGSSGRSGGWITSPTRSARWLLGLPIGICVAWLAYLPMHAIAARHQVEHLRVTPSMLGPIAIAGFFHDVYVADHLVAGGTCDRAGRDRHTNVSQIETAGFTSSEPPMGGRGPRCSRADFQQDSVWRLRGGPGEFAADRRREVGDERRTRGHADDRIGS